jgi:uncharacterized membrane protein YGL010W
MNPDRGPNLVAWQWSIYSDSLRDGLNLAVHIVAVPLFWVGVATLIYSLVTLSPLRIIGALLLLFLSLLMQNIGHKREKFRVPLAGSGISPAAS